MQNLGGEQSVLWELENSQLPTLVCQHRVNFIIATISASVQSLYFF